MKKIILLVIFLLFCNFTLADSIINYDVLSEVPLNNNLTISGKFLDDLNKNTNIYCDFYILNGVGKKIYRISSKKTDLKGNFYADLKITENYFKRGEIYTVLTICDQAEADANFFVTQKETIFNPLLYEFKWVTESGNVFPIILIGGFLLFFIIIIVYLHRVSVTGRMW